MVGCLTLPGFLTRNREKQMKYLISAVLVIGFCVLAATFTAQSGNLNTSGKCPTAGTCSLGNATNSSFTVVTDGGTVTLDGSVSAKDKVTSAASGVLSAQRITLLTATADYTLTDCGTSTLGNWYTLVMRDASETASIIPASGDTINYGGITPVADDELDSPTAAATSLGSSITLVCGTANNWFSVNVVGTWVDGGAS
jgi:hypothetical protein